MRVVVLPGCCGLASPRRHAAAPWRLALLGTAGFLALLGTAGVFLALGPAVARADVTGIKPVSITATAGAGFTGTVATFFSADSGPYTVTIQWGDGTLSSHGTVSGGPKSYQVDASHTFAHEGKYKVNVSVTDTADGTSASTISGATVSDAPITLTTVPINATRDVAFSGVVGHLTDEDPAGAAYGVTIDWGDGSSSAGATQPTSNGYDVTGTHTWTSAGNFHVTTSVHDPGGASSAATNTATVIAPGGLPSVAITSPASGVAVSHTTDVRVSGTYHAASGASAFCVTTGSAMPAVCDDTLSLTPDGHFYGVLPPDVHTGDNFVTAWIRDGAGQVMYSNTILIHVDTPDLEITNMEVTQATQARLPNVLSTGWSGARAAIYNGVSLTEGKATIVRVWAGGRLDQMHAAPSVRVQLTAYAADGRQLGAPLQPLEGTRTITSANDVTSGPNADQWSDPSSAYTFALPDSDLHGTITLVATVNPSGFSDQLPECSGCAVNNTMTLAAVRFSPVRTVTVTPLELIWIDKHGHLYEPPAPSTAFSAAVAMSPFNIVLRPYQAALDISRIASSGWGDDTKNNAAFTVVHDWTGSNHSDAIGDIVGLQMGVARGLTVPSPYCCDPPRVTENAVVEVLRPITSVAHEFYHEEGFLHAGHDCHGDPGGVGGLQAVNWDPDHIGMLQSTGTDTRLGSGGSSGALRIYGLHAADPYQIFNYDFMSYCAAVPPNYGIPDSHTGMDGGNAWISAHNWTAAIASEPLHLAHDTSAAPASRPHRGPTIQLFSLTDVVSGKTRLVDLQPGSGSVSRSSKVKGASIVVRGPRGKVESSTAVQLGIVHVNRGGFYYAASATVPAPAGAKSIELRQGKHLLALRLRPRHAPAVTLKRLRSRHIAGAGTVTIRYRIRNPGRATLTTSIDYQAKRGAAWRTVAMDSGRGSSAFPAELLSHSSGARLRVRVSDGWSQAVAVSPPLRVDGPKISATIADPLAGARVASDAALTVRGTGIDDAGQPIAGTRLRWYLGARSLGTGSTLSMRDLPSGRRTLTLVATAPDGRSARRTIPITVTRARPALIFDRASQTVRPGARRVTLRLAASEPSILRLAGHTFRLARRARRLTISIRRGSVVLAGRLDGGGATAHPVIVLRR